jgi:hypothetical protein
MPNRLSEEKINARAGRINFLPIRPCSRKDMEAWATRTEANTNPRSRSMNPSRGILAWLVVRSSTFESERDVDIVNGRLLIGPVDSGRCFARSTPG